VSGVRCQLQKWERGIGTGISVMALVGQCLCCGAADYAPKLRADLDTAIEAGKPLELPAGRFLLGTPADPKVRHVITLRTRERVAIRGVPGKTELIITDPRLALCRIMQTKSVEISGIVIDYETAPYAQGTVVGVDPAKLTFDLDIDEGFPLLDEPVFAHGADWGMTVDPQSASFLKDLTWNALWTGSWTHLHDRIFRLSLVEGSRHKAAIAGIEKDDRYCQLPSSGAPQLISSYLCASVKISDVTIHGSVGLAIVCGRSGSVTLQRIRLIPRDRTNRLIAGNRDGIHLSGCRGPILIEDCEMTKLGDDGININVHGFVVTKVLAPDNVEATLDHVSPEVGDRLQVTNREEGRLRGTAKIAEITPVGKQWLGRQRLGFRLDRPIPGISVGDCINDLDSGGEGFVIRRCKIYGLRRYGALVHGSGTIENNTFTDLYGYGIVANGHHFSPKPGHPKEGPMPYSLTIKDNVIERVARNKMYSRVQMHPGAIQVVGYRRRFKVAPKPIIHNVTITGNRIKDPPVNHVFLGAVSDATLSGPGLNDETVRVANCERIRVLSGK